MIDSQVHFREPGLEHKEDLATGSRSAVLGGVTAVFEMPNTKPADHERRGLGRQGRPPRTGRMHCDFAFFVGATRDNVDELAELERLPGAAGVKVFLGSSTGDLLVDDEETLARILATISRRAAFHSEDEARLRERMPLAARRAIRRATANGATPKRRSPRPSGCCGSPPRRASACTCCMSRPAEEMALLALHKDIASVEVTPQHLTLATPEAYEALGTRAQMNPPLRDRSHQARLWWGLEQGVVDVLGSDHAPHTLEEKAKTYPATPSGMPGVQTLVPVMLDHVNAGRLSLARFVDLTSAGPQRIFGIAGKGRIAVGYDADLTIVDLKAERVIENDMDRQQMRLDPFAGRQACRAGRWARSCAGGSPCGRAKLGEAARRAGPLRRGSAAAAY